MEWLLVLAAMLSTVTGAFSGVREADARIQQTEAASAAISAAAAAEAASPAPTARVPTAGTAEADFPELPAFAVITAAPLDKVRLIE